MRIKRFIAPDMRTALRMVRDEQGPDAVILSNRHTADGIEVVAATDYDEALVAQALRAAAPGIDAPASAAATPAPAHAAENVVSMPAAAATARPAPAPSRADAMIAALSMPTPRTTVSAPSRDATPVHETVAARARAVFRIDEDAASAEAMPLRTRAPDAPKAPPAFASLLASGHDDAPAATAAPARDGSPTPGDDFRALLARLTEAEADGPAWPHAAAPAAPAAAQEPAAVMPVAPVTPAPVAAPASAPAAPPAPVTPAAAAATAIGTAQVETVPAVATATTPVAVIESPRPTPALHAVATPAEDPALVAMRSELSMMRELIERQMDQYAIERLRGSVGRAHVFDTLVACGCDEGVAQSVASRIDARLAPGQARELMFAELARMIVTNRAEPIDDGGVIALVGPTGAGKTTTAAKLAARFAARHRARDVALVTTDTERAGAREQLHVLGRRLGVTVCEAEGPEGLNATLAQLADYPLVLVDTAGYAARDRALLGQILWLRTARRVRSLLVLPANAHPHDLAEIVRRYRPASPEGVVLTKTDETGRLGAALSVLVKQDLSLAYTTGGQQVPADLEVADATRLAASLETLRRASDNPLHQDDHRHAVA